MTEDFAGTEYSSRYETDAIRSQDYTIRWRDLASTIWSIVVRASGVYLNIQLAINYHNKSEENFFSWTLICMILPMIVTSLIYGIMRSSDGDFDKGCWHWSSIQAGFLVVFLFYPFRYVLSLIYGIKCKQAERLHDREKQEKYYNLTVREEADVALIRLFECFLEIAPQKILQIYIVVTQSQKADVVQIVSICFYIGGTAWCLTTYHRYIRFAQRDKYNITITGCVVQFCWHMCITGSRTICITFMTLLYPIWTIIACFIHALILTFIIFIMFRPTFPQSLCGNFVFCFCSGAVYVFTYINMRDGPTQCKYSLYYIVCLLENVVCIVLFAIYAPQYHLFHLWLLYLLSAVAIISYLAGIGLTIIYYTRFHPRITARTSSRLGNNNTV